MEAIKEIGDEGCNYLVSDLCRCQDEDTHYVETSKLSMYLMDNDLQHQEVCYLSELAARKMYS